MGLNSALNVASRSLALFSTGIEVAGHNVANSSTPGFIREVLDISTAQPYEKGGLLIGTGANLDGIRQEIDIHLEQRIYGSNADAAAAQFSSGIYQQFQTILNELGEDDLSTHLNTFVGSINDLINQPEVLGLRSAVIDQATTFADKITKIRGDVDNLRDNQNSEIDNLTGEANQLIDQIAEFNVQIVKLEASSNFSSNAGGLRTQRYEALNRLSEILPIEVRNTATGSAEVFSGTNYLVLGSQTHHLESFNESNDGFPSQSVRIEETQSPLDSGGGELNGLISGRDSILGDFVGQLDSYASAIIFEFNKIHSSGEGLKSFEDVTGSYAVDDSTAALNDAGLAFTPKHGSFEIKVIDQGTGAINTSVISIDLDGLGGNDTSLDDLQAAISGVTNLTATVEPSGELSISAANGYEFRFGNDTSDVLASLGINTFFTGTSSDDIAVNSIISNDSAFFATGQGGGDSDTRNAVLLAGFIDNPIESLNDVPIGDFYESLVSSIAQNAASDGALADGLNGFRDSLLGQRAQISGVSLDEEAVLILQYQQAYQASARIVTTIDELFNTLISL